MWKISILSIDLSKQYWCPLDGTKNSNLLIEFSNSISIQLYFKAFWHWTYVQNTLTYIGSFSFKLFICPPDVKKPKFFRDFTPWTPTKAPPWTRCRAYSTLRPSPAFCNIWKSNLSSITDISKIAWINPCWGMAKMLWPNHIVGFSNQIC